MSKREISETKYTLPQVKQTLEAVGEENLDQFQRRTLDYVSKFVKVDAAGAEFLMEKLVKEYGFLAGGRKIIETQKLAAIVNILNEKRTLK
jgi:DNA-directed RNA polymerase subunit F